MDRYICQLHVSELNLREVYVKLDGTTTDSKPFSGPIGKMYPVLLRLRLQW